MKPCGIGVEGPGRRGGREEGGRGGGRRGGGEDPQSQPQPVIIPKAGSHLVHNFGAFKGPDQNTLINQDISWSTNY